MSEKYEILICMAGITREGELRRIYPMPFKNWQENPISKRSWIRYKLREAESSDGRCESRKIDPTSVEIIGKEDTIEVRNILERYCTSLEKLSQEKASLGIVKPILKGFTITDEPDREAKAKSLRAQQTLEGGSIDFYYPSIRLGYQFRCKTMERCSSHDIMCEDWEAFELYRKMELRWKERKVVDAKVSSKLHDWMLKERDLYFVMGTHFRFKTWLVISLLYPPKRTAQSLFSFDEGILD